MTYEIYRYIYIGGASLAALFLVISVVLFVVLKIPSVFGDLTGRTAKKAIQTIREQNSGSGEKVYKPSQVNRNRCMVTDKISPTGSILSKRPEQGMMGGMCTEKISTQQLAQENETTVLDGNETTVLNENETTVLTDGMQNQSAFEIEFDITFVHTNEVIS